MDGNFYCDALFYFLKKHTYFNRFVLFVIFTDYKETKFVFFRSINFPYLPSFNFLLPFYYYSMVFSL